MKKLVIYTLAMALVFMLVFAACTQKTDNVPPSGQTEKEVEEKPTTEKVEEQVGEDREMLGNMYKEGYPIVKEKITLKFVGVFESTQSKPHGEMQVVKEYEEKTNVHIEWELVPEANKQERLNLIFASMDLPDAFIGRTIWKDAEYKYGLEGLLIPLNDLIEQYGVHLKLTFERRPEVRETLTTPDGNIYGLPAVVDFIHRAIPINMFINNTWLDNLGLSIPDTTEEFYQVLKAFKERDPNGNGKSDEIPFSSMGPGNMYTYESLFGSFGVLPQNPMVENGKVLYAPVQPGYKEAIKFFNKLYKEGLLDEEIFTHDLQQYQAKGKQDEMIYGVVLDWHGALVFTQDRRDEHYIILPPLIGPEGDRLWYKDNSAGGLGIDRSMGLITSINQYPEITMRWIDGLYEEETSQNWFNGPEGLNWERTEDGRIRELPLKEGMSAGEFRRLETPAIVPAIMPESLLNQYVIYPGGIKIEYNKAYHPYTPKEYFPDVYMTEEESERVSTIASDVNPYVGNRQAQWIVGDRSIEDDWAEYIDTLNRMGLDELLEIWQKKHDEVFGN